MKNEFRMYAAIEQFFIRSFFFVQEKSKVNETQVCNSSIPHTDIEKDR